MTVQKIMIRPYDADRPVPLLELHHSSKNRFAEFAGGATAECAVVCCCFPISVVNLIVLVVYGVPAGLYRKALRNRRRRRLLKRGGVVDGGDRSSSDGSEWLISSPETATVTGMGRFVVNPVEVDSDVMEMELENEMWDRFYGTGFWRSGSRSGQFDSEY